MSWQKFWQNIETFVFIGFFAFYLMVQSLLSIKDWQA